MQKSTGNTEEQLVTYVQQIEGQSLGWQAVHLHLSRLAQADRKEYNIRIALNGLHDLIKQREGRIFLLDNQDVVVMLKGAQVSEVKEAIFQTKFLFQEDPLTKRDDAFSTWYDLSISQPELFSTANKLLREKLSRRAQQRGGASEFSEIEPLDPSRLFKLQEALSGIDLSGYMRRQPICVMMTGHAPQPVFEDGTAIQIAIICPRVRSKRFSSVRCCGWYPTGRMISSAVVSAEPVGSVGSFTAQSFSLQRMSIGCISARTMIFARTSRHPSRLPITV